MVCAWDGLQGQNDLFLLTVHILNRIDLYPSATVPCIYFHPHFYNITIASNISPHYLVVTTVTTLFSRNSSKFHLPLSKNLEKV